MAEQILPNVLKFEGLYEKLGYEAAQGILGTAFNLVAPKPNWKAPVKATVDAGADVDLLYTAVVHFTGSVPVFKLNADGTISVKADGYYKAIGS
jgi:hypothetical protein